MLLLAIAAIAAAGFPCAAATLAGRCVAVYDGDTILVQVHSGFAHAGMWRRVEIRLQGIDAPERGQRYGQRSRSRLRSLVYRKEVQVEWHKRDQYGRLVGEVSVGAIDANLAQIEAGLAWVYRQYLDEVPTARGRALLQAEAAARRARLGLWRDSNPLPPWEWRHRQHAEPRAEASTPSATSRLSRYAPTSVPPTLA